MFSIHNWIGKCQGIDANAFFDDYEASVLDDAKHARDMDAICMSCNCQSKCLAFAVSNKEWGLWGGVYFEDGKISKAFNAHKSPDDWANLWVKVTHQIDK